MKISIDRHLADFLDVWCSVIGLKEKNFLISWSFCVCVCCGKNCFQDVHDVTAEQVDVLSYVQVRNYELKCMLILLGLIRFDQIS